MRNHTSASLWSLLASLLVGCTGTDVGNPVVDIDFALHSDESSTSITYTHSAISAGPIAVTDGWVSVAEIRLRSGAECADELELEIPSGVPVDLFASGSAEGLSDFMLQENDYCRLSVTWDGFTGQLPAQAPAELAGSAIVLQGTRTDGTKFLLWSDQDEKLLFDARNGTFPIASSTQGFIVGLNATKLFDGIDLDTAIVSSNGIIRISPTDNEKILDTFQRNLSNASKLFEDRDDDGDLNPDEHEEDDIIAE